MPSWENYVVQSPEVGGWTIDLYGADVATGGEPVTLDMFAAPKRNLPPVATAALTQTGMQVAVDATGSGDPEGQSIQAVWDFGDGTGAAGLSAGHTYASPGSYTVRLVVSDTNELVGAKTVKTIVADAISPTTTIATPGTNATYAMGQVVTASYSCQDEPSGSGIRSCVGPTPNGQRLDTSTVGPRTFTVTATDNAGNRTSLTRTYAVSYSFTGFFCPGQQPTDAQHRKRRSGHPGQVPTRRQPGARDIPGRLPESHNHQLPFRSTNRRGGTYDNRGREQPDLRHHKLGL